MIKKITSQYFLEILNRGTKEMEILNIRINPLTEMMNNQREMARKSQTRYNEKDFVLLEKQTKKFSEK